MNVFGLLGVLFVGLKLADVIYWSWWLVLSPFFIQLVILIGIFFLFVLAELAKNDRKAGR